jgi:mRNA interferase HigB
MRIVSRSTLLDFVASLAGHKDQPAVRSAVSAWFKEAKKAKWSSPADVKHRYATASIIDSERVVFNIKGNAYRLVVAIDFAHGVVWIKWIGSHKAYDEIDVAEVDYEG